MTTLHEHDLFPVDGDEPSRFADREILGIKVFRQERGGLAELPAMLAPDELPNAAAVFDRWGGGSYQIWAYGLNGPEGTTYRGRLLLTRLNLAGPAKPFPEVATEPQQAAASVSTPAATGPAPDTDWTKRILEIATAVQALALPLLERADRRASAERERSDRQFALVLQSTQENNRAMIQVLAQARTAGGELAAFKEGQEQAARMQAEHVRQLIAEGEAQGEPEEETELQAIAGIAGTVNGVLEFIKTEKAATGTAAAIGGAAQAIGAAAEVATAA